jgi:hypothetical protein
MRQHNLTEIRGSQLASHKDIVRHFADVEHGIGLKFLNEVLQLTDGIERRQAAMSESIEELLMRS